LLKDGVTHMDFELGEKAENLRGEIREFALAEVVGKPYRTAMLEEESDDSDWAFSLSISKKLAEKGWLCMNWPKKYGGQDASMWEQFVYMEESGYWEIPGTSMGILGVGITGPSLQMFGNEEQKARFLPMIAAGSPDGIWCTAYSEPNSGSDYNKISTLAIRDGDDFLINGQKVWTSCAHRARWCWLACKTDPNAQKIHKGMSIIIVDMKSPGITVRPLINTAGIHSFNEVFFDNVRVPATNLVGEQNRGFYMLIPALAYERLSLAPHIYGVGRRLMEDLVQYSRKAMRGSKTLAQDPVIRHKLAERSVELETLRLFGLEIMWKMSKGMLPGYESARNKIACNIFCDNMARTGLEIIGANSQVNYTSPLAKLHGRLQGLYLLNAGWFSAAGTMEIQRNVIGQYKLGLPRAY
jgi:alkylation response protein AidB-like acyl-CoA dehydrogenase